MIALNKTDSTKVTYSIAKEYSVWKAYYMKVERGDAQDWTVNTDVNMKLLPAIQGWTVDSYELIATKQEAPGRRNITSLTGAAALGASVTLQNVLQYTITYRRSTFTQLFAMAIVVVMWILSVYLLVLAVDHVIVRRRPLEPDTVGYAVGMLFALPALRLLLDAPFGRWVVVKVNQSTAACL